MNLFKQFNSAFTSNLSMFVVLTALLALMFPSFFTPLSGYVSVLLQIIMFTMGLTLKASDFSHVLKNPTSVIMVSAIQYLFMPLSAFAIAKLFGLSGDVALGLIIVGSVPGGTASNIMALLANWNVPLSVSATTVSTLLSPFVTPLLIATYGGAFIEIAFLANVLIHHTNRLSANCLRISCVSSLRGQVTKDQDSDAIIFIDGGTVSSRWNSISEP